MLIKLLFLAFILYFVVKTERSLINAVRGDGRQAELEDSEGATRPPTRVGENVEDARYVDL